MHRIFLLCALSILFISTSSQGAEKNWADYSLPERIGYYLIEKPIEKWVKSGFTGGKNCRYDESKTKVTIFAGPSCNGKPMGVCKAALECTDRLRDGSTLTFEASATCAASPNFPSDPKQCIYAMTNNYKGSGAGRLRQSSESSDPIEGNSAR